MKRINIAELLKDCPKGMELDCTMYDNVTLDRVDIDDTYAIRITTKGGFSTRLTRYGQNVYIEDAKCVIFPKGKTTWEGFVLPCKFKDGDIIYTQQVRGFVFIRKVEKNKMFIINMLQWQLQALFMIVPLFAIEIMLKKLDTQPKRKNKNSSKQSKIVVTNGTQKPRLWRS